MHLRNTVCSMIIIINTNCIELFSADILAATINAYFVGFCVLVIVPPTVVALNSFSLHWGCSTPPVKQISQLFWLLVSTFPSTLSSISSSLIIPINVTSGISTDLGVCPKTYSYGVCFVLSCTWLLMVSEYQGIMNLMWQCKYGNGIIFKILIVYTDAIYRFKALYVLPIYTILL